MLINSLAAGAGVAALAGLFTAATGVGAVAGVVAAAVLGIGAAAIGICASWGNGIYINQLWTGQHGCWGQ